MQAERMERSNEENERGTMIQAIRSYSWKRVRPTSAGITLSQILWCQILSLQLIAVIHEVHSVVCVCVFVCVHCTCSITMLVFFPDSNYLQAKSVLAEWAWAGGTANNKLKNHIYHSFNSFPKR
jgi:hypothetical protein